ncbi:MAG: MerR family transcriptional regulator [Alphaproteobacteria bacterium]|nr:MerR family transcriptional regulator [Alphaproteobacteria bacterium]MDX5367865.1 MerR family transcriptional regulator [Alphaproteobacteria bacterium]MDX5462735.1 MerR family transcriptional regulator [Alphaproteobacteria bacterium]
MANGRTEKSPEAFRTISEVAAELEVPQHVLRFWETRFGQVRPLKRSGGRRYYRPEDIELLRGIRTLLYSEGLTIRGVQKILKEQGVRHVSDIGRGMVDGADAVAAAAAEAVPQPRPAPQPAPPASSAPAAAPAPAAAANVDRPGHLSPDARRRLAEVLDELDSARALLRKITPES